MTVEPVGPDPIVEQARAEGFVEGRTAAAADIQVHLVGLEFRAQAAARGMDLGRLNVFLEHSAPDRFLKEDGTGVDVEMVTHMIDMLSTAPAATRAAAKLQPGEYRRKTHRAGGFPW